MNKTLYEMIEHEAQRGVESLGTVDVGSETYADVLADTLKLIKVLEETDDRTFEMEKARLSADVKTAEINSKETVEKEKINFEKDKLEKDVELRREELTSKKEVEENKISTQLSISLKQNLIEEQKIQIEQKKIDLENRRIDIEMISADRTFETEKARLSKETIVGVSSTMVSIADTVINILAYNRWFKMGLNFEETGSICTKTVGNLFSKLKPKM